MIYNNVLLHNVDEVRPEQGGVRLCRIPNALRETLNPIAQGNALCCCGVEIRFVLKGESASVTLQLADENLGEARRIAEVYYGSFQGGTHTIGKDGATITVKKPEKFDDMVTLTTWHKLPFHPQVVRILVPYGSHVILTDVQGDVCLPAPEQLPEKTLLIYGSSLTHGASAVHPAGIYAWRTAAGLGTDLINLGIAGGCMLEPQMADYIAGRTDWDVGLLEMGVNYQWDTEKNQFRSPESFQKLVEYLVPTVAKAHPDKPLFCVGFYPSFEDFYYKPDAVADAYRRVVKETVQKLGMPNVVYLPGEVMMPGGVTGLSTDLLHPSAQGAVDLSHSLVAMMKNSGIVK